MSRRGDVRKTATKKGIFAIAAGVGTGLLFAKVHWILGLAGSAGTLYLAWDWLLWRGKNGLRLK